MEELSKAGMISKLDSISMLYSSIGQEYQSRRIQEIKSDLEQQEGEALSDTIRAVIQRKFYCIWASMPNDAQNQAFYDALNDNRITPFGPKAFQENVCNNFTVFAYRTEARIQHLFFNQGDGNSGISGSNVRLSAIQGFIQTIISSLIRANDSEGKGIEEAIILSLALPNTGMHGMVSINIVDKLLALNLPKRASAVAKSIQDKEFKSLADKQIKIFRESGSQQTRQKQLACQVFNGLRSRHTPLQTQKKHDASEVFDRLRSHHTAPKPLPFKGPRQQKIDPFARYNILCANARVTLLPRLEYTLQFQIPYPRTLHSKEERLIEDHLNHQAFDRAILINNQSNLPRKERIRMRSTIIRCMIEQRYAAKAIPLLSVFPLGEVRNTLICNIAYLVFQQGRPFDAFNFIYDHVESALPLPSSHPLHTLRELFEFPGEEIVETRIAQLQDCGIKSGSKRPNDHWAEVTTFAVKISNV